MFGRIRAECGRLWADFGRICLRLATLCGRAAATNLGLFCSRSEVRSSNGWWPGWIRPESVSASTVAGLLSHAEVGRILPNLVQIWPKWPLNGPTSADPGSELAELSRGWSKFDRGGPDSGPNLADICRIGSKSAEVALNFSQSWSIPSRIWQSWSIPETKMAQIGLDSLKSGRRREDLARFRQKAACIQRTSAALAPQLLLTKRA